LCYFIFKILPVAFIIFLVAISFQGTAQVTVKGTVYNMNRTRPLESVSVVSSSGRGTVTDSNGNYSITVRETDSISFSYLGRNTMKYPVNMMLSYNNFDIALHVEPSELKSVRVAPRDYHMDSLQNRQDYAKYFDYKKPKFKITEPSGGTGVGLDLDEIINMFRFNRNRRMLAFQQRLLQEERDNFIDHRFSKLLVKKITHMNSSELDTFMIRYRPSYNFTKAATDYDFDEYIKLAAKEFRKNKNLPAGEIKKEKLPF
jgi:hypothetical protein